MRPRRGERPPDLNVRAYVALRALRRIVTSELPHVDGRRAYHDAAAVYVMRDGKAPLEARKKAAGEHIRQWVLLGHERDRLVHVAEMAEAYVGELTVTAMETVAELGDPEWDIFWAEAERARRADQGNEQ